MPRRAVIYTRISSDREGRELGVDRQEEDCRRLAEKRGDLEVVHVYRENDTGASSKSTKPRPQYRDMLTAARNRQFDVVLAYSTSRLTRRPLELEDLIVLSEQTKVVIYTDKSGDLDLASAQGRMLARVLAAADANEAEQTAERVTRAAQQRRERGGWHGGTVPYGYKVVGEHGDRRLAIEPVEAERIREAARRILAGDSIYGICAEWNAQGITTKRVAPTTVTGKPTPEGKHWRQGNLRAILLNRATVGENRIGVKVAEPVLDERTFERIGALLGDPSRNVAHSPGRRSTKYTLAGGVAVCSCGHPMVSAKSSRGRTTLICSKAVNGPEACGRNRIDHEILERFVMETVVENLKRNPRWAQRSSERNPERDAEIAATEAERDDLVEQQDRLADAIIRGSIDARVGDRHAARIRSELDAVRERLNGLLGRSIVSTAIDDGLDWKSWTPARRRNLLRGLLDRVEVSADGYAESVRELRRGQTIGKKRADWEEHREATLRTSYAERVAFVPRHQF